MPRILLFRGRGIIASAIRWQTRGQYSHVAIQMDDGRLVEAWQGSGVQITELKDTDGVDFFTVKDMTEAQWKWAQAYCLSQVGKKYDYWSVLRFVSRNVWPENDKWFCSELIFRALQESGVSLLRGIKAQEVSPQLLSLSPMLVQVSR